MDRRIDTQAKEQIKALAANIGRGNISVSFGLADGGYVRCVMTCPHTKGDKFEFDRVGRTRSALPDILAKARRLLTKLIERHDNRDKPRTGALGHLMQAAGIDREPAPPALSNPDPAPDEQEIEVPDLPPTKELRLPKPVPAIVEPGQSSHLSNKEVARAAQLLGMIGDQDEDAGTYTYLDGYSDEVLRALVNGSIKVESYAKVRRETFGKLLTEVRQKKMTKDQQIEALTDEVAKLKAEIVELKAKLPKPKLALPSLNGSANGIRSHA